MSQKQLFALSTTQNSTSRSVDVTNYLTLNHIIISKSHS